MLTTNCCKINFQTPYSFCELLKDITHLNTTYLISLSTDATVSLQTITSVTEGSMFNVSVELTTSGTLACDLEVTLMVTPGNAIGKK